jgi:hypothetical protein
MRGKETPWKSNHSRIQKRNVQGKVEEREKKRKRKRRRRSREEREKKLRDRTEGSSIICPYLHRLAFRLSSEGIHQHM